MVGGRGGMDLADVFTFTRGWHGQPWRVGNLPAALEAEIRYDNMGSGFLGASSTGYGLSLITLNERVRRDALLHNGILAHEGGHLLTKTTRGGFCGTGWRPDRTELPAWCAAGLLVVSAVQASLCTKGHRSVADIAEESGVPIQLAQIGLTLRQRDIWGDRIEPVPLATAIFEWLIEMRNRLARIT